MVCWNWLCIFSFIQLDFQKSSQFGQLKNMLSNLGQRILLKTSNLGQRKYCLKALELCNLNLDVEFFKWRWFKTLTLKF
jgi:hypothetical protein